MSLIGPRPLLVQYLPLYSEKQKHRHDVRPGLSGYAQVNGRNSISWTHKFELDCEYVEKITFLGDLKILFQTIGKAFLKQEGISSDTSDTMEARAVCLTSVCTRPLMSLESTTRKQPWETNMYMST